MKIFHKIIILLTALALSSCAALSTSISKKDLDVQTKMSNTIFLDPVAPSARTIFIQVRNTSDKPEFNIESDIRNKIAAKGYKVVNNPARAHYILQANILQAGRIANTAAEGSLANGYGDVAAGAVAGGLLGGGGNSSPAGTAIGALVGAGVAFAANNLVKDVNYSLIVDLQISEKAAGVKIINKSTQTLNQGTSGAVVSTYNETNNLKKYQTRILSSANKANLKWEEASPLLVKGLTDSIAGMF